METKTAALELVTDQPEKDVEHIYETGKDVARDVAAAARPEHAAVLPALAGQHSAMMWILLTCAGAVVIALLLAQFFGAKPTPVPAAS